MSIKMDQMLAYRPQALHVDDPADALLDLAANGYAGILDVAGPDAINRYDLGVLTARRAITAVSAIRR